MANTCSLHFMISSSGLYMKWSILLAQVVSGGLWSSLEVGHLTDHFKNHLNPLRPISCSKTFFSQSESWKPANKKPGRVGSAPLTPRLTQSGQRRPPPPSSHLCNTGLGSLRTVHLIALFPTIWTKPARSTWPRPRRRALLIARATTPPF